MLHLPELLSCPHCSNHLDKGHMQPQERVDLLNLLVFSPGEGRIASVVPKTPRLKIHVEGYKLAVSKKSPGLGGGEAWPGLWELSAGLRDSQNPHLQIELTSFSPALKKLKNSYCDWPWSDHSSSDLQRCFSPEYQIFFLQTHSPSAVWLL